MGRSFSILCTEFRSRFGDGFDNSLLNGRFAEAYEKGPDHVVEVGFGNGQVRSGRLGVTEGPVPVFTLTGPFFVPIVIDMQAKPV